MKDYDNDFDLNELDDEYSDIEVEYDVIYVKYSKYSKLYAYLIIEDVKVGDMVWVEGKDYPLEVIKKETVTIDKLPVPYDNMKYATTKQPVEDKLIKILKNNPILRKVEKNVELVGRDSILEDLLISINKKRMRNSILIGNAGSGKTTIVEAFSDLVKDSFITLGFNVGELIAGTSLRGMLEEKITKIFNDVLEFNKNNQMKIILFIDEFHMMTKPCCSECVPLTDILKPYLTNSDIIVIGATTIREYNENVKKDAALMRRITPIYVKQLSDSAIIEILDNFSNHKLGKNLLNELLINTKSIPNTSNPDISLEVLDRVMSVNEILGYEINMNLINKEINKIKESYEILG